MDNKLQIVVDDIIYQIQSRGGISRLFSEIFPRMCCLDDSLHISLLTERKLRRLLPRHPRIKHRTIPHVESYLRPWRVWNPIFPLARRLVRKLCIGRGKGQIWHSTYYTLPERWGGLQVVTVVDMIHERFQDLFNGLGNDRFREQKRRCVMAADAVICISDATRQDVQRLYRLNSDFIYVVPLAYSDIFRQLEQCEDGLEMATKQPFLLYVGDRTHYKNFNRLIQAYDIWQLREQVALVVVGKPWLSDEARFLVELGLEDRVHLLTNVDDEELCLLYNKAVAFAYPSLYEGFGIPLLEAMACGCPVIASSIPSTIEVAGDCPIYFEPAEVDDLVNAFDVALSEGRNSKRVQKGLERVKLYSWDRTAQQTLELYRSLS